MLNPFRRPTAPPQAAAADDTGDIRPCGLCLLCVDACPTGALRYVDRRWSLDLGLCIFCQECAFVCPNALIADPA